jgi:hypothetical protein
MSLRSLNRITCVVLGHGGCECRPMQLFVQKSQYCSLTTTPVTAVANPLLTQRKRIARPVTQVLQYSSTYARKNDDDDNNKFKKGDRDEKAQQINRGSIKYKLTKLWKQYGVIAVTTYLSIYLGTLGSVFLALDYDIFNAATVGLDPAYAIEKFSHVIETFTGNTSVPAYIRDNPRGMFIIKFSPKQFPIYFSLSQLVLLQSLG